MREVAEKIYQEWHTFAKTREVKRLINLYNASATLESPLVPIILNKPNGILKGKGEILAFLEEGTKRRPNEWVKWYRTKDYFIKGNTLIWEYPRATPTGNQVDILEVMELKAGKIQHHRIYWGWFGVQMLLQSQQKK